MRTFKGIIGVVLMAVLMKLLPGCAGTNPFTAAGLGLTTGKDITDLRNDARRKNYEDYMERQKEMLRQMMKKAKVTASTIEVDAEKDGLIRQKIGNVRLNLYLRENNGVGATFDSYTVRIICEHDYFVKSYQEERVGNFYFVDPVTVSPFQTTPVVIKGNKWVRKNINRMNRLLSSDDVNLELILKGEDQNGHKIEIRTTSGKI